jgi:hypothetical protein
MEHIRPVCKVPDLRVRFSKAQSLFCSPFALYAETGHIFAYFLSRVREYLTRKPTSLRKHGRQSINALLETIEPRVMFSSIPAFHHALSALNTVR